MQMGPPRATRTRKVEQRATKSRGVTHFINCVGSRSCPLEKSADLIKLPRTLGGGSSRKKWCKTEPCKHSTPYLLRMRAIRMLTGLQVSSESFTVCYHIWISQWEKEKKPGKKRITTVWPRMESHAFAFPHMSFKTTQSELMEDKLLVLSPSPVTLYIAL